MGGWPLPLNKLNPKGTTRRTHLINHPTPTPVCGVTSAEEKLGLGSGLALTLEEYHRKRPIVISQSELFPKRLSVILNSFAQRAKCVALSLPILFYTHMAYCRMRIWLQLHASAGGTCYLLQIPKIRLRNKWVKTLLNCKHGVI